MKKLLLTLFAALIALVFAGCVVTNTWETNAVAGKGSMESYEINVGRYSSVKIQGYCEVRYYSAASDTVKLEVQPNLREYYIVEVVNDELVVRSTRRINASSGKTPVLTVSTPNLSSMIMEGACNFVTKDKIDTDYFQLILSGAGSGKAEFDVNSLIIVMSGAGQYNISGKADSAEIMISGAGDLNALSLQTFNAGISMSGAGSVSISCSENLMIDANGVGSVVYRGSPSVNSRAGGLVSIKKVD